MAHAKQRGAKGTGVAFARQRGPKGTGVAFAGQRGPKGTGVAFAGQRPSPHDPHPPTLSRERRLLSDAERVSGDPDADSRLIAEARSGHDAVARAIRQHPESGPELTAGDIDAKWEDAYAVGDEAPGGDNPTPDQNEVDAIGRALGTEYADDEELMGGEEIGARDAHRWELDPDSRDPGADAEEPEEPGDDED